jgi:flagellar biosynthesis anti-sigma factor FlgM
VKIEANRSAGDTEATQASSRTAATDARVARTGTDRVAAGTDRVEVSQDAQLLASALAAAEQAPAIRADVVERARQKLNAGEIGNDSTKLADQLIDDLLDG